MGLSEDRVLSIQEEFKICTKIEMLIQLEVSEFTIWVSVKYLIVAIQLKRQMFVPN